MMRVIAIFVLATVVAADYNGWGFVYTFVETLREECNTKYTEASKRWAKEDAQCTHEVTVQKGNIQSQESTFQTERAEQEREESKAAAHGVTLVEIDDKITKTENEQARNLQEIEDASEDFDNTNAEYADNIAVLQKAVEKNMKEMDDSSCVPRKNSTLAAGNTTCPGFTNETLCVAYPTGKDCRWERPDSLNRIHKMLNTLQEKFRTEQVHANDDYLQLKHKQELAKQALAQQLTSLNAQKNDVTEAQSNAQTNAANAASAANDAKVAKLTAQSALQTKQVACATEKQMYDDAGDHHTVCQKECNDMANMVQSAATSRTKVGHCVSKAYTEGNDNAELNCRGKSEDDCSDPCQWVPAESAAFVQMGMKLNHHAFVQLGEKRLRQPFFTTAAPTEAAATAPAPVESDYSTRSDNHNVTNICSSITNLITARVGCALSASSSACDLDAQSKAHCEGRKCKAVDADDDASPNACDTFTTEATCVAVAGDKCEFGEAQTCQADMANTNTELTAVEGTVTTMNNEVTRIENTLKTKTDDIEEKRKCISDAVKAVHECQTDLDSYNAQAEQDKAHIKETLGNSADIVNKLNSNWSADLDTATSTASKLLTMLTQMQTTLQFEYAQQEQRHDQAIEVHSSCLLTQRKSEQVCQQQLVTRMEEVALLESEAVSTQKSLANAMNVESKTKATLSVMTEACEGADSGGSKIAMCQEEFKDGVEDLQNAHRILCA